MIVLVILLTFPIWFTILFPYALLCVGIICSPVWFFVIVLREIFKAIPYMFKKKPEPVLLDPEVVRKLKLMDDHPEFYGHPNNIYVRVPKDF